jgi:hypothetical protein
MPRSKSPRRRATGRSKSPRRGGGGRGPGGSSSNPTTTAGMSSLHSRTVTDRSNTGRSGSKRDKNNNKTSSSNTNGNNNNNNNESHRSSRSYQSSGRTSRNATTVNGGSTSLDDQDHPDLAELEERLNEDVDDEFFQDPRKFHTLHRVIDVLGMQLVDDLSSSNPTAAAAAAGSGNKNSWQKIDKNPAYRNLKEQQQIVEEAIEHLALIHCADLNGSVVQVGRVARQFHDAVSQVRHLRKQVKEIQETLGATTGGPTVVISTTAAGNTGGNAAKGGTATSTAQQAAAAAAAASSAMSLRELWLKKLECEAVLSLLEKLDTIRAAPLQFDNYLHQHRIGAAVLCVAGALDTMFSSDVSQVQALHKIMEQLMIRKQRAEEVVWELFLDVLFLRTGNGMAKLMALGGPQAEGLLSGPGTNGRRSIAATAASVSSGVLADTTTLSEAAAGGASGNGASATAASQIWNLPPSSWDYVFRQQMGIINPFLTPKMRFALDPDLQVDSILLTLEQKVQEVLVDEDFYEDDDEVTMMMTTTTMNNGADGMEGTNDEKKQQDANNGNGIRKSLRLVAPTASSRPKAVIPPSMMEAEFDLEADERRSLEEQQYDSQGRRRQQSLLMTKPTYLDHILALRTLVECLVRLRRLDDVERILTESLERELSLLVQREQARTFLWVEKSSTNQLRKSGRYAMLLTKAGATTDLRDFRRHLNHILSAFGNVQVRLMHLTQIIRHKLVRPLSFSRLGIYICVGDILDVDH